LGLKKTALHRFGECRFARNAWAWGTHIINKVVAGDGRNGPWVPFN
jgi:hypothetical protein